jgi:endonuclease YncB( thermonuclease family)
MRVLALLAVAMALALPARAQDRITGRVVGIPRGDALSVRVDGWTLTVRMHGIACPTAPPELVERTRTYLNRRIAERPVHVTVRGTASSSVIYGDVLAQGAPEPLNLELARVGLAHWAQQYAPNRADIAAAVEDARMAGRGIWTDPTGATVALPQTVSPIPKTPTATPMPKASPARASPVPSAPSAPAPRRVRTLALVDLVLPGGGLLAVLLLFGAARLSQPAARVRALRPTLLTELDAAGWVKVRGVARLADDCLVSVTGRVHALFLQERTERYAPHGRAGHRTYAWTAIRSDTEIVPFVLEDGPERVQVTPRTGACFPMRQLRYYNDFPVERWHDRPYDDDTRTVVRFIPPDAPVTVVGRYLPDERTIDEALVIEGEESRVGRERARGAVLLVLASIGALAGAFVLRHALIP